MFMRKTNPVSLGALLFCLAIAPSLRADRGPKAKHHIHVSNKSAVSEKNELFEEEVSDYYNQIDLDQYGLSKKAFECAYKGYVYLLQQHMISKTNILSICDFSQSSRNR